MQFPLHGNHLETTEVVSMQFPSHGNLVETTEVVSMKGNHVETRWKLLSGFHALETIWKLSTCRFRMVSTGFPFHGNSFFRAVMSVNFGLFYLQLYNGILKKNCSSKAFFFLSYLFSPCILLGL